jgi:hypothetical protein
VHRSIDGFLLARVAVRVLMGHYLALRDDSDHMKKVREPLKEPLERVCWGRRGATGCRPCSQRL